MRVRLFSRGLTFVLITAAVLCGGCLGGSPSPTFYALTPVQDQCDLPEVQPGGQCGYRHRPGQAGGIPRRVSDCHPYERPMSWPRPSSIAGSAPSKITSLMSWPTISVSLVPTERIYLYPWRLSVPIDYQVTVDVVRCDGRLGDAAELEARWSIFKGPGKKLLKMSRSSIREPVTGADYAALVAAQSRAVAKLSQEIVRAIKGAGKN